MRNAEMELAECLICIFPHSAFRLPHSRKPHRATRTSYLVPRTSQRVPRNFFLDFRQLILTDRLILMACLAIRIQQMWIHPLPLPRRTAHI